jgi:C-terminal processing protease CtpA/Prc
MEEDWDAALLGAIPAALRPSSFEEHELLVMSLLAKLHDGHANAWSSAKTRPPRGDAVLPVAVRFVGEQAIVTGGAGLERGDAIVALDGVPLATLVEQWRPYYGASHETGFRELVSRTFGRGPAGPVAVTIERQGRTLDVPLERVAGPPPADPHDHPGPPARRLSDELAYLTLSSVVAADATRYVREAAGAEALVIDIRNYPSEFVVFALGQHLVDGPTPFATFTVGDLANPGAFGWVAEPVSIEPASPRFDGRIAILVDEKSMSQSEYTAMAFRSAPGAVVVGGTTAGADGNVSTLPLPGRVKGMMTGIGVFWPDRRPTQRIGVVPDLAVAPTIEGIRAGRDEVLEAAVRHLLGRDPTAAELAALEAR